MAHQIRPGTVHSTLVRVAGDGQSLDTAALAAQAAGDALSGAYGTAAEAAAAFAGFWSARSATGERISALVLHQATCVAQAADAFIDSDGEMTADALSAMGSLT
ncbi:MAG: hypothetical protein QJR09_10965 [Micrococcus sp.]|nr:hypothetical protein [Micrococcus sp.]